METSATSRRATPPCMTRLTLGNMEIDPERFETRIRGRRIDLTFMEFELLSHLARNRGKVLSPEQLLEVASRVRSDGATARLRIHISRLRKKIAESSPWTIRTVQKRGYILTNASSAGPPPNARGRRRLVPTLLG